MHTKVDQAAWEEVTCSCRTEVDGKLIEAKAACDAETDFVAGACDSRLAAVAMELCSFRLEVGTRLDAMTRGVAWEDASDSRSSWAS